jgi:bleomycin hydrolase
VKLTDSIACTEVKDQSQSPTCWVFGTNSLFESDLLKTNGTQLNLSEMFVARYAYIDKAIKWLATKGKTYYEGGGQFHDVIRVVQKYGLVPEEVYDGRPDGNNLHNHSRLDTAMQHLAWQWLASGKTKPTRDDLRQMNDTLDRYLGKVPESFWYDDKQYTPKTFAAEELHFQNDYIEIMSFANLPYYKKCLLTDKYNWAGDSLYNLPIEDFKAVVDTALSKGWSVGWEGDVTNAGFDPYFGRARLNEAEHDYGEERATNYKNESTERDHMLHMVGMGKDQQGKKWYYLKNSWGSWQGPFHGYLYMNEEYFKLETIIIMVNKKGLPNELKRKLQIE